MASPADDARGLTPPHASRRPIGPTHRISEDTTICWRRRRLLVGTHLGPAIVASLYGLTVV
eukprot:scaffold29537_cov125-Isochrysis_galbana.AAC.1